MGEQRMIAGCLVLQEAPARKLARCKVVLCEMPLPPEPTEETPEPTQETDSYVVWYIDRKDKPFGVKFFKARAAAKAEFGRRTGAITHG